MLVSEFSYYIINAETKRQVLSETSKVYDPLGIFQPITVRGRILIRDLWANKLDWDTKILEKHSETWRSIAVDLNQLSTFSFDRNAVDSKNNSLVIFCDSSKVAYGFSAYAVGDGKSNLIFAKSKVSPIKPRSLPTLELLSAFLAMKCLGSIFSAYEKDTFSSITLAVDAQIVLSWILSGEVKTKNVFTANRVSDVLRMKSDFKSKHGINVEFRYVQSSENPADMLTRGMTIEKFRDNFSTWMTGPSWLSESPLVWPESKLGCISDSIKTSMINNVPVSNTVINSIVANDATSVSDVNRFSSWNKLIRSLRLVFSFINKARKASRTEDFSVKARKYVLQSVQSDSFSEEIKYLKDTKVSKSIPPLVNQLDLFIDDSGLLRSRGRIAKTLYYDYDVINPIVLPTDNHVTNLLIKHYHLKCRHLGLQTTINAIRSSGFWIPRARQVVKKALSDCITCRKFNSFSFKYPKFTNISKTQANLVRPYLHTGIDYTGALYLVEDGKSVKYYILVYTCMSVRAVHLDLLPDMNTESFLMSFIRFTNLYGIPSHVYSDNALSFIAGSKLLSDALLSDQFSQHLIDSNIKHVRIPTYSPWVGSLWESMVKVVKSCLLKSIGRAKLTYFQLLTALSDIQNAINSRPLTY